MRISGIIIYFLFFCFCQELWAAPRLYLGTSIIKADINDPNFKFVNEKELDINSLNVGVFNSYKNFTLSIQTNRLINYSVTRSVVSQNGTMYQNKSKMINDTVLIGYRFDRFIPSMLISNTKLNKSLWYKGNYIAGQTNNTLLYGVNFGYLLTKNINANLFLIAPNKELYLKSAAGISLNYLF